MPLNTRYAENFKAINVKNEFRSFVERIYPRKGAAISTTDVRASFATICFIEFHEAKAMNKIDQSLPEFMTDMATLMNTSPVMLNQILVLTNLRKRQKLLQ